MQAETLLDPTLSISWLAHGGANERARAGRKLARLLHAHRPARGLVLALPPGGIAVASEIAHCLRLPLDVLVAQDFVTPGHPHMPAGAICEGGGLCLNAAALRLPGVTPERIWREARRGWGEIGALLTLYRARRSLPHLMRRSVILVDDGVTDGLIQLAAVQVLQREHIEACIIATPWGVGTALRRIEPLVARLLVLREVADAEWDGHSPWQSSLDHRDGLALLEAMHERQAFAAGSVMSRR